MLTIFEPAPSPFKDYIVASCGYDEKSKAYEALKYYPEVTTQIYFNPDDKQWYILSKA